MTMVPTAPLAASAAGPGIQRLPGSQPAVLGAAVDASAAAAAAASDPVALLVSRATYGPTKALLEEVRAVGTGRWLAQQLDPLAVADPEMDALLTRWPRLDLKIWQAREANVGWDLMFDVLDAHTARAVWSRRQLLEVMVDFWSNHLNVTCPSDNVWDNRHRYDRDVIRPYALGRFSDMLQASAVHPAMLGYLSNRDSSKKAPNENYGREVLELHTVGRDAGYTEDEIKQSALIFTGLSTHDEGGEFDYRPWRHHVGPVKVLGFEHPNPTAEGGQDVARAYLSYLASHPATARRIAGKLAVRFVSDDPSSDLVDRLAASYLANGTAVGPVLQVLFTSSEFAASAGQKTRRPYEDLVAGCRALGVQPPANGTDGVRRLLWAATDMGQAPLGWRPPDGYPDVAGAWGSASGALARWNAHTALGDRWWSDQLVQPQLTAWLTPLPATYGALVDRFGVRMGLPKLSATTRTAVSAFFGKTPTDALRGADEVVTWRYGQLAALLLDSPEFAAR